MGREIEREPVVREPLIDVNDRGTLTAIAMAVIVFWPVTLAVLIGVQAWTGIKRMMRR